LSPASRHLLPIIAYLLLFGCGGDDGPSSTMDSRGGIGADQEMGDGKVAYQHEWDLVKIVDTTVKGCDPMGPGVEIDAVELVRDGAVIGHAAALADVEPPANAVCPDQASPVGLDGQTLGAPDGAAPSLNGATLYLLLSAAPRNGDLLVIHELDPEGEAEEDCFRVYLGRLDDDGEMTFTDALVHAWNPGDANRGCETLEMAVDALW